MNGLIYLCISKIRLLDVMNGEDEARPSPSHLCGYCQLTFQDNVRDWYYEPIEPEECQDRIAA